MMGLEKLFVGLYGTTPQIDLDKNLTKARVAKPTVLDFEKVATGLIKNNVAKNDAEKFPDIFVTVSAGFTGAEVVFHATGQKLPFRGAPPPGPGPHLLRFRVLHPLEPARTTLEIAP